MAFLFQSNPDQWDLRRYLQPGQHVAWFVSRYQSLMRPGALVLLWEAQGRQSPAVKGLYGWGITTDGVYTDDEGRRRIRLRYVERWVHPADNAGQVPDEHHIAPVPAKAVMALPGWQDHPLAVMPIGTNFLVTVEQLQELWHRLLDVNLPGSQLGQVLPLEVQGVPLDPNAFEPQRIVAKEVGHEQ